MLSPALASYDDGHRGFVIGVSLMHSFTILAETAQYRYGTRHPRDILSSITADGDAELTSYLYQMMTMNGALFFADEWRDFLHWYERRLDTVGVDGINTYPCVPSLISNRWYLSNQQRYWSLAWLNRYAFESGKFMFYHNWRGSADTTLLANQQAECEGITLTAARTRLLSSAIQRACLSVIAMARDDPVNNAQSQHVSLLSTLNDHSMTFPPLQSLIAFDLFFDRVNDIATLRMRTRMFAPHSINDRTEGTMMNLTVRPTVPPYTIDDIDKQNLTDAEYDEAVEKRRLDWIEDRNELVYANLVQRAVNATRKALPTEWPMSRFADVVAPGEDPPSQSWPETMQDRCFVIGSVADVSEDEDDKLFKNALPPVTPSATHPAYRENMTDLYIRIYEHQTSMMNEHLNGRSDVPARFVLYAPRAGAKVIPPFDRLLRGLYFSFLIALCSHRMLILDMYHINSLYSPPIANVQWDYRIFNEYITDMNLTSMSYESKHDRLLRHGDIEELFPAPLLIIRRLSSEDHILFANIRYSWYAHALWHSPSRMVRLAAVMSFLFSKPKPALLSQSQALATYFRFGSYQRLVYLSLESDNKTAPTTGDPFPGVAWSQWTCVHRLLSTFGAHRNRTLIYFNFAVESEHSHAFLIDQFSAYGSVKTFADSMKKTHAYIAEKLGVNISRADVVNGYLYGMFDVTITSGSSFGVFNGARTGFKRPSYIARVANPRQIMSINGTLEADAETEYCGPIRRMNNRKRADIDF